MREELLALRTKREPDSIDQHVGSRVRLRRLEIGWSQSKLADAIGVTFQQVRKYENGSNRIGASRLQNVSESLGVPVAFFFEDLDKFKRTDNYPEVILPTSEALSLVRAFVNIRERKMRRRILVLIEQIANSQQASH